MEEKEIMNHESEGELQRLYIEKLKDYVKTREEELGRKLKACVVTFGCQMNARDSEKLLGVLVAAGFEECDNENADLVLYNTCSVRENANHRVYGRLGYVSTLKKKNKDMIICLCGCMMQDEKVVEEIKKKYRYVNLVFGTHNIFKFAQLLYTTFLSDRMVIDIWKETKEIVEDLPSVRKYSFKQGVNIMYGCDKFCTYCIVPYVRGRERSRKIDDIVEEIKKLVEDGVVEVMLLGQNVNSYGKNLEGATFAKLLSEVEKIEGLKRIRIMTPYPTDFKDDVIEVMEKSDKICPQIHLPLQSGSNRILKKMNRGYTREEYIALAKKLRERIKDVSISTDIIVGFPGETYEDFKETIEVCKELEYDSAYTFIYSKRSHTPAAAFPDQVPEEEVKKRFDELLDVIQKTSAKNADKYVGRVCEVLVESVDDHQKGYVTGRLANGLLVHFEGCESMIGSFVNVRLEEAKGFYYIGKMV